MQCWWLTTLGLRAGSWAFPYVYYYIVSTTSNVLQKFAISRAGGGTYSLLAQAGRQAGRQAGKQWYHSVAELSICISFVEGPKAHSFDLNIP